MVPMMPLAPGRLSMTTDCFRSFLDLLADQAGGNVARASRPERHDDLLSAATDNKARRAASRGANAPPIRAKDKRRRLIFVFCIQ